MKLEKVTVARADGQGQDGEFPVYRHGIPEPAARRPALPQESPART